jgi:hypothetical protein
MYFIVAAPSIVASVVGGPDPAKKTARFRAWRWVSNPVCLRAPIDSFRQRPEKGEKVKEVAARSGHLARARSAGLAHGVQCSRSGRIAASRAVAADRRRQKRSRIPKFALLANPPA